MRLMYSLSDDATCLSGRADILLSLLSIPIAMKWHNENSFVSLFPHCKTNKRKIIFTLRLHFTFLFLHFFLLRWKDLCEDEWQFRFSYQTVEKGEPHRKRRKKRVFLLFFICIIFVWTCFGEHRRQWFRSYVISSATRSYLIKLSEIVNCSK